MIYYRRCNYAGNNYSRSYIGDYTVVYLKLPYEEVEQRLGDLNARGVTLQPGQTLRDLYEERTPLYEKYADLIIDCSRKMLRDVVAEIAERYKKQP